LAGRRSLLEGFACFSRIEEEKHRQRSDFEQGTEADAPEAASVAVPIDVSLNRNLTSPEGVPLAALTVAVNFTLPPLNAMALGVALTAVLVAVPLVQPVASL